MSNISDIVILGGGESGIGAAQLAQKKGYKVFLSDAKTITHERKYILNELNISYEEKGHTDDKVLHAKLAIKSPGIPNKMPLIQKMIKKRIPIVSEIEFAYRFINKSKIIAVTGTNGKTTTSSLIYHMLKTAGKSVVLGGNSGSSLAKLVATTNPHYFVVEVSSFQLDDIFNFRPDVAVLLNISPDHMDRYDHNFSKYITSKFKIIENLTQEETFIYNADSRPVTKELNNRKVEACMFAISAATKHRNGAYVEKNHMIFNHKFKGQTQKHKIPMSEISLIGNHNILNSMAAVLSALHCNLPISQVVQGLKTFKNQPHRLEFVGEIDNIRYINDSKATNVDAVYYALDGIKNDIIWIAGGIDKGNDYNQIAGLVSKKVKGLICLGKDNKNLKKFFGNQLKLFTETTDTKEAVNTASQWAKAGYSVLFSPACSSFDLFENYEDRGNKFKKAVDQFQKTKQVKQKNSNKKWMK